jgi:two-component system osmolarity sensor histidine kinase EnvZ
MPFTLPRLRLLKKAQFWRKRLGWLKSGLFWRTFFLLAFMIVVSMAVWLTSYWLVERAPRAHQVAARVISIVTITRSALLHSAPDSRRELLFDLASNEGIRVYSREPTDSVVPPADASLMPLVTEMVRDRLGDDTQFADEVNDIEGFWVSFEIEDDQYWLMLDRKRMEDTAGVQWIGWASAALLLALLGGVFISRLINLPLSRLSSAARALSRGQPIEPLPEEGPVEIREMNRNFNQMVHDLERLDADRNVILAGISHDLRTPISRMLLEVEMAGLPDDARTGMQADLAQMDAIIAQFLDFARPGDSVHFNPIDLSAVVNDMVQHASRLPDVTLHSHIAPGLKVMGDETDLKRVLNNLVENARRYGKSPGTPHTEIDVHCEATNNHAVIIVADHGAGVPESDMPYLLRPFTRMDNARGQANGAGLGLAIVDRVVQRHQGKLQLSNRAGGGLSIRISLPLLKSQSAEEAGQRLKPAQSS